MNDRDALDGLLLALHGSPEKPANPWVQAMWMLIADFAAAAVPILPFVCSADPASTRRFRRGNAPPDRAGIGRARIAKRDTLRTVAETVAIGIAAALAGIIIGVLVNRGFGG